MDAELRRGFRQAATREEVARVLSKAQEAGWIERDRVFLAALLGDPAARLASSENDDWPEFMTRDWTDLLAYLGLESCVRVLVAFGRFYGGDERSREAVRIGDRWLAASSPEEQRAAAEEARQLSIGGTLECWERLARLLLAPPDYLDRELWLLLCDEGRRADLEECEGAVRAEVGSWALDFSAPSCPCDP